MGAVGELLASHTVSLQRPDKGRAVFEDVGARGRDASLAARSGVAADDAGQPPVGPAAGARLRESSAAGEAPATATAILETAPDTQQSTITDTTATMATATSSTAASPSSPSATPSCRPTSSSRAAATRTCTR